MGRIEQQRVSVQPLMNFKRHDLPIEAGSTLVCLTAQRGRAGDVQTDTTRRHWCG